MGKFCPKCGNEITNADSKFCNKCGTSLGGNITSVLSTKKNDNGILYMVFAISAFLFVCLLFSVFIVFLSNNKEYSESTDYSNKTTLNSEDTDDDITTTTTTTTTASKKEIYGYNDTFKFADLEITIGNELVFKKINSKYSEYNGKTVVGIPFTIKNLSKEKNALLPFQYRILGSYGMEVRTFNSFFDDTFEYADDLQYNDSYTKYTYCLYDGDGIYAVEFKYLSQKISVIIMVTK